MKLTVSKENYLKAIAEAEAEGESLIAATLARWLNVSAPAVTMAIRRLKRDNLIDVDGNGYLKLTAEGRAVADRVIHRHLLIERMLSEIFGMEWYRLHDEAEQLEHAVSAEFERRLLEKLGNSDACPHGNRTRFDTPADRRHRGWLPLEECQSEWVVRVASVYERDRQWLEQLDELGIRPDQQVEVVTNSPGAAISLRLDGRTVSLALPAARRIWVEPVAVPAHR